MADLLHCPFCDGEAFVNEKHEFRWGECRDCGAEGKTCLTEAEAIAAWNTRAERTCCIVQNEQSLILSRGIEVYIGSCSECGTYIGIGDSFCPECGSRVMGDNLSEFISREEQETDEQG